MKGLFVQLNSTTESYLDELLTHLYRYHPEIKELAFTDVAYWNIGMLKNRHAALSQFRVWIGAAPIGWYSPWPDTPTDLQDWMYKTAGVGGMLTPSYRWAQIGSDEGIAREAASQGWSFYIGQEVGIDALGDHHRLRQAWEAYLIELMRRVYAIDPNFQVLWSPYAWDLWSSVDPTRKAQIAHAMTLLVTNVKTYSLTRGISVIDLQDGRGAQPAEPESDAVNWYKLIKNCGVPVRINSEWFKVHPELGYIPQTIEEMTRREAYYKLMIVPVGCCWEARYWLPQLYANHKH